MMRFVTCSLFALLAAATTINVIAAPTEDQITALVAGLDSPAKATRDAAEQKLAALGSSALELLPQATADMSPELKLRLGRVRSKLETVYAEEAGKASLVTIAPGTRPLIESLSTLARQSGNSVGFSKNAATMAATKTTQRFDATPFWQALDQTLDAADATLVDSEKGGANISVVARDAKSPLRVGRAAYVGPFRLDAVSLRAKRDTANPAEGVLRMGLEIAWEPRLRPISMTLAGRSLSASDESGKAIAVLSPTAEWNTTSLAGQFAVRFDVPLSLPAAESKSLKSIKGRMTVLLPGREMQFRFDKLTTLTRPISQKKGDATVRLESFRREGKRWRAVVRVLYNDPQDAVQSHHGWLYESHAKLIDAKGQSREPANFDSHGAEDGVEGVYDFDAPDILDGFCLAYSTPAVIMTIPVDFELKNVPIEPAGDASNPR